MNFFILSFDIFASAKKVINIFVTFWGLSNISYAYNCQDSSRLLNEKPNIIFIFADDMGWGDLGCYGNTMIKTPNIDKMAKNGVLFTNFYVSSPVCSPSRVAMMTGNFPSRHNIHNALGDTHEFNEKLSQSNFLNPNNVLLTRLFHDNGYKVGHFGKWHLGATPDAPRPQEYGIDKSLTANSVENNLKVPQHESNKVIINNTIDFINENKNSPLYINVWFRIPHALLEPTREQMAIYENLGPQGEAKSRGFSTPAQIYYSSITDLDKNVGRLLNWIDSSGLGKNTIIIFSSDNGPEDMDVRIPRAAHSSFGKTGPLRGRKRSLYEGGIREPFIIQWNGVIPKGLVDNNTVIGAVDLLPTFCSLAGIKLPDNYLSDGEDVKSSFFGAIYNRKKPLFWEFRYNQYGHPINASPQLALRIDKWKFLMNPDGSRKELYDLTEHDGMEVDNLADKNPNLIKEFSKLILNFENSLPPGNRMPDAGKVVYPMPF